MASNWIATPGFCDRADDFLHLAGQIFQGCGVFRAQVQFQHGFGGDGVDG